MKFHRYFTISIIIAFSANCQENPDGLNQGLLALLAADASNQSSTCGLPWLGGSGQNCAMTPQGIVTTFAGNGTQGSADGNGTSATFFAPEAITTDGKNLYVADSANDLIRKIVISTGEVTTLAGTGAAGFLDATGTNAQFNDPTGLTTDGTNVFVSDTGNHLIRKINISTAEVTTLAGTGSSGSSDGTGTAASFSEPAGITSDGTNLYLADRSNHRIRKIVISTGVVTTLAGSSTGHTDGTGTGAQFSFPEGITTDGTNLYVADTSNSVIRKIVISTAEVTTLAGSGAQGMTDGNGTSATFNRPIAMTTDGTNIYVGDSITSIIRKIEIASADVTTLAGSGDRDFADGTGSNAKFLEPRGITTDGKSIYVSDMQNHRIRRIK